MYPNPYSKTHETFTAYLGHQGPLAVLRVAWASDADLATGLGPVPLTFDDLIFQVYYTKWSSVLS